MIVIIHIFQRRLQVWDSWQALLFTVVSALMLPGLVVSIGAKICRNKINQNWAAVSLLPNSIIGGHYG